VGSQSGVALTTVLFHWPRCRARRYGCRAPSGSLMTISGMAQNFVDI
jgi:hypothetical protein